MADCLERCSFPIWVTGPNFVVLGQTVWAYVWKSPRKMSPLVPLYRPVRAPGCKNRPSPFPGRMSYKATKPGLVSVLYLSMHYTVWLFIRAPFYVSLVFVAVCSVFWLFWLSYQYLPSDWLERLLWGSLSVARGSSPESPGWRVSVWFSWFIVLLCSIVYFCCLLPLHDIIIFLLLWCDISYLCWKCR